MNTLKAFAHIGPLANDTVGAVGELSSMSLTFTRDKALNSHVDYPGIQLVTFSNKLDGVPTAVSDPTAYSILGAINWVYLQASLSAFDITRDSFQQAFILHFGTTFDLIASGAMVEFGGKFIPESVEFAPKNQSADVQWLVWFDNTAFYNQFDEYDVTVIQPVPDLDAFFGTSVEVNALIASITATDLIGKADAAKGNSPYTVFRDDLFDWVDPTDPAIRVAVDWPVIIYGFAGDNLDVVKEAVRTWIIGNSTHDREDWALVFPDLFTSTEFIITPMWGDYAIPNATRDLGIYSPNIPLSKALALTQLTCNGVGYTDPHISTVISLTPSLFRSVALAVVGGPENRDGVDTLTERYPDLINVPSTHIDFMRMSEETRQFVVLLNQMLEGAESLTPATGVPHGFNRLTRDGVVYLTRSFGNFLYLVVTKYSVDELTV